MSWNRASSLPIAAAISAALFSSALLFSSPLLFAAEPGEPPPLPGKATALPKPAGKPRLAFLELTAGPEVTREVAQAAGEMLVVALADTGKFDVITKADVKALLGYEAQAQLMGCGEASCMVDLGGALGAAYLVSGSLGRLGGQLQLTLALIDVNAATVGKRVSLGLNDSALQAGMRDAIQRLTGEVALDLGPADACGVPPCAREAISACKTWWEKEWDALTIIGIVPDGPMQQLLVDGRPARIFRMLVRTRARDGARDEYLADVRFKKVDGDWYFDQASMGHVRSLPIKPDDPPSDAELVPLLSAGFATFKGPGARVLKLTPKRFPDYSRARPERTPPEVASWYYLFGVTYSLAGKTQICWRAGERLVRSKRGSWVVDHVDEGNCEEVLDAQ